MENLKKWLKSRSDWKPFFIGACVFAFIICQDIVHGNWGCGIYGCASRQVISETTVDEEINYGTPTDEPIIRTIEHKGYTIDFEVPAHHNNFDFTEYPEVERDPYNNLISIKTFQMPHFGYFFHVVILQDADSFKAIAFVENAGYLNFYQYDSEGHIYQSTITDVEGLMDEYGEKDVT